jgi:nitrogen fixation/metabolism regulation signal transduction histidine kinase
METLLKNGKTHPEHSIIRVRVLILIYSLLCVLTVLFSKNFFKDVLQEGEIPGRLNLIVFFTIPVVLIIVLGISVFSLINDFITKRPGSKFNARLLAYFTIIVIFSAAPATLMTGTALNEIIRFWQSIDAASTIKAANGLVADYYSLHLERFENIIKQNDFSRIERYMQNNWYQQDTRYHTDIGLPQNIAAVQTFYLTDDIWAESFFAGNDEFRLSSPSSLENGFTPREMPRDYGVIRYVQKQPSNTIRIINYDLKFDFDWGKSVLEKQANNFELIDMLRENLQPLLLYYYVVFFLPTLLMTVIIAISFTRRITHPIVELTEATRRVAEGNFNIQILSRRNDELGLLIRSFNAMVQDLEKSREALVKTEKISIWQNMAQQLAHEIKNPLTPIKLSAERVLRRWQNNPESVGEIIESSMMAIIQETEGLSALLNEFRALSKPMEASNIWTFLREPLEEIINAYSNSYPTVKFNIEFVKNGISVKIDKNRLTQIFTNLLVNAIDAMNGSGWIEIRSDIVKKHEVNYCRISVKDSGKGIGSQDSNLVFTPYFTTKQSGTGLGLPIIERIVNDHAGAIWFDSAEGAGTTFYIDLPAETKLEFSEQLSNPENLTEGK